MLINNKKFLLWFIRLGRTKSRLLYFLFLISSFLLISVILDLIEWAIYHDSLANEFKNLYYSYIFLLYAAYTSWFFYGDALNKLSDYKRLEKKGLSPAILAKTAYINKWTAVRRAGIARYCLYDGGLIAGCLLMIPVSAILFPKAREEAPTFPEFHDMMYFILKCLIIGYVAGMILYRVKWTINERKFRRLGEFHNSEKQNSFLSLD